LLLCERVLLIQLNDAIYYGKCIVRAVLINCKTVKR